MPGREETVTVYPFANADVYTLARHIPGVREVATMAALAPAPVTELAQTQARRVRAAETDLEGGAAALLSTMVAEPERWLAGAGAAKIPPFIALTGRRDGRLVRVSARLAAAYGGDPEPEGAVTAVPLALAAEMMLRAEIAAPGVHPPEACIEPGPFFAALSRHWRPPPPAAGPIIERLDRLD